MLILSYLSWIPLLSFKYQTVLQESEVTLFESLGTFQTFSSKELTQNLLELPSI